MDSNIGNFQAITNGVVETSSPELNAVFQTYNVFEYSNNGQITRCDCNVADLKISLQNLNAIVSNVNDIYCGYTFLLDTKKFDTKKVTILPNPFSTTFEISSNQPISNYKIFDIVGKEIVSVNSKQDLDSKTKALKSGVYLLELTFDNSKSHTIKLIKN